MSVGAGTALAKAALTLRSAARVHKRSEAAHRRAAAELTGLSKEIGELAAAHGVEVDPHTQTEPKGGQSRAE